MNTWKEPKNTDKVFWTKHSIEKMKFYNLTPQRVLRVMRRPDRCQEAVAPGCVACMQTLKNKAQSEIWMMYVPVKDRQQTTNNKQQTIKKKIITAWRYPTVSPIQDQIPIPNEILEEAERMLK